MDNTLYSKIEMVNKILKEFCNDRESSKDYIQVVDEITKDIVFKLFDCLPDEASKSELAFFYALNNNTDRYRVIEYVTDSRWVYKWASIIGDKEIMRDRVTKSKTAYIWAINLGDREIMREKITDSKWAYYWATDIGDKDFMRDRITESKWAYNWARDIGDIEIMRERITEPEWLSLFEYHFQNKHSQTT